MKKILSLFLLALFALPLLSDAALAHGPTRKKVIEVIEIAAPPEKVWALVKDFDKINVWHPAIAKVDAKGGNEVGATRTLTLEGGGTIDEELKRYEEPEMMFYYVIKKVDPAVLPVSSYSAYFTVMPGENGGSKVQWKGGFYRSFTGNNPPPEQSNEAAVKAVTGVYKSGLENLKKLAESQ